MPSSRVILDDASMPQPRASRWRLLWRTAFVGVFAAWSLLLLAWLTLHWGILPNARAWLPQIEQQAGRALGATVRIGDLRVRSGRWVPAVELDDVVLLDAAQREVLRLPRIVAAPSARSLLVFELRLQQLLIDGADVELRRDAAGALHVAGFALGGAAAGDGSRLAEWFFRQREFVVRGARVRWVDESRDVPPLALEAVDLVVRNGVRSRDFRLDATPPAAWGERFSLRGQFSAPLLGGGSEWHRWSGTLHADLPHVDVAELRRRATLPFELDGGGGALRAWVDVVQGEPTAATVDLALAGVALRLAPELEPFALQQVHGRLALRRDGDETTATATGFGFVDGEGGEWPAGDLTLTLRQRPGAPLAGGELRAERLDLALLAGVVERLPVGAAVRGLLDELQPAGLVEPLQLRWEGPLDAPARYRLQARVRGLALAARPSPEDGALGRPGGDGATIELDADERGGRAQVVLDNGRLVLPGLFEQPAVALQDFAAAFEWRLEPRADGAPPRVEVQVRDARFANADARGAFDATWRTGDGAEFGRGGRYPGRLELRGRLDAARADAVARYLPLGLPEATRRYVERAVRGGRLSNGRFVVDGDLWDFPFAARPDAGTFRVTGRAEGIDLAYVPDEPGWTSPWPAFGAVAGDLEFDRASMAVRNGTARFYGVELRGVTATIADMVGEPLLQLDGLAEGPTNDLLRYLAASPVGGWLDDALARASASGRGQLQLSIGVPLDDPAGSRVRGVLRLDGNDVQLAPDLPLLAGARGEVEFTDGGFTLRGVRARVFGGETTIEGGPRADGALQVTAAGRAGAEALRSQGQIPALAAAARVMRGEAAYRLQLDWAGDPAGEPAVDLTSDLVGMAVDLPEPLAKGVGDALAMRLRVQPLPADATPGWRDEVHLTLGTSLEARLVREGDGENTRVRGGGYGVRVPAPRPDAGVAAEVALERLDLDAWMAALDRLAGPDAASATAGYLPQRVGLRVGDLQADGRRLTGVVATLTRAGDDAPWRAVVDADQMTGSIEWRPGGDAGTPGGVRARLSRLHLPPAASGQAEAWLDRPPQRVPALDIVVDDFAVGGLALGRLEVEAVNAPLAAAAGGHEWQLARLRLLNPEARFTASGRWRPAAAPAPARMDTDFRLELSDGGALLARLGMPDALRGGAGEMRGELSWRGSPLAPHAPSMNGRLQLALRSGKFLQADSGAARVLSVLSLQALPRRLTLDFRDVFEQGFEFDEASGDVVITEGVARTNNLRMRGLQAGVLMEGEADLARETQDLRVIVVPEINAGTASLLYSIINPVVGMSTFVAQLFLRQPLMQAGTREFRITGSWAEPKVERVERTVEAAPAPGQPVQ